MDSYLPAPDPRSKVTLAQGLIVLLKNILLSREPIYGLGEWAEAHAPDLLGLTSRQVKSLNDDCVGRCLERLFDTDYSSMVMALIAHVVREFEVDLDQLHNDSTTFAFFGSYQDAKADASKRGKPTLAVTYGHSKDHRPDLKQLLFILTVARDGAVPVYFTAADGNVTDDRTHRDTWDLMCQLTGKRDFLYVADSKLATSENMAHVHQNGGRFITALPRTRTEDKRFRELVRSGAVTWKDAWSRVDELGELVDVVQTSSQPATTSEGYRLLWFHSLRKQKLDAQTRARHIEKTLEELAKLRKRLRSSRTRFRQRAKVTEAVEKILQGRGCGAWIDVEVRESEEKSYRQAHRGRAGKDTHYVRSVRLRFDLDFRIKEDEARKEALTDGVFPLVTNVLDLEEKEVLLTYKKQARVEKRFSQIKTDYEVAPVYLKNVDRIEALLCVYFLALLTQALIERELRRAMADQRVDFLPLYPEGRPCKRPCTRRVLDLFQNIQRHELTEAGQDSNTMVTELSPIQREVLGLLGVPTRSYGRPTRA
jgi:transposase